MRLEINNGVNLTWTIENASKLNTEPAKPKTWKTADNLEWSLATILVRHRLFMKLRCVRKRENLAWICDIDAKIRLLKQNRSTEHFSNDLKFCANSQKSGQILNSELWENIENNGYIRGDDCIVIELEMNYKLYDFSQAIEWLTDYGCQIGEERTMFWLNRGFLAANSKKFYDKFYGSKEPKEKFEFDEIQPLEFCQLLSCFHPTSKFIEDLEQVDLLISLANRFEASCVHDICEEYLIEHFDRETSLRYADQNGYQKLMDKYLESLETVGQIKQLQNSQQFWNLSLDTKNRILLKLSEICP